MFKLLVLFLLHVSLFFAQTFREIVDVAPQDGGTIVSDPELTTRAKCEAYCVGEATCFSFTISGSACLFYSTRFGFNSNPLINEANTIYYEKPIDIHDNLGEWIQSRIDSVPTANKDDFLVFYREPAEGFRVSNLVENMVVMSDIESAEECAKYCTRKRGVIDDVIGTRCHAFNYNSDTMECQLLSQYLQEKNDGTDNLVFVENSAWNYYEKLMGTSCWVVSQGCRKDSSVFTPSASVIEVSHIWEHQCMEEAKYYHEDVCDGYSYQPTHVIWGPDGVYGSWNSQDFTTGCVIDLGRDCTVNERFTGTFRDSIGEDQFAAWYKSSICFERAEIWYNYCGFSSNPIIQIEVQFPNTNEVSYYPIEGCKCNNWGIKIDPASQLAYCTRDLVNNTCSRTRDSGIIDTYSYPDILCSDTTDCNRFSTNTYDFTSNSHCYLIDPFCNNDKVDFSSSISDGPHEYYEIGCGGTDNWNSWDCDLFQDNTFCLTMAEEFEGICDNTADEVKQQFVVWHRPTGVMEVFPEFVLPDQTTIINGLHIDAAFTVNADDGLRDGQEEILLQDILSGRRQIFTGKGIGNDADNFKFSWLRQISMYYAPQDLSTSISQTQKSIQYLTLTLFEGDSATQSYSLAQSEIGVNLADFPSDGKFIHFPISNDITIEELKTYTWSITATDGSLEGGRIGFVSGNLYEDGASGFGNSWDYLFVLWIEYFDQTPKELNFVSKKDVKTRPWFEVWFWILVVFYVLLIIFLIFLHYRRKKEEKEDRERERQLQKDIINQYRTQGLKPPTDYDEKKSNDNDNNNDDKEVELEDSQEKKSNNNNNNTLKPNEYENVPRESGLMEIEMQTHKNNDIQEISDDYDDDDDDVVDDLQTPNGSPYVE